MNIWQEIEKRYAYLDGPNQSIRRYHTIDHAIKVANTAKALALPYISQHSFERDLNTIFWAGIMHDLYYEPGCSGNEWFSAELGWNLLHDYDLDSGVDEEPFFNYIMATKISDNPATMDKYPFVAAADLMDFSGDYKFFEANYYKARSEFPGTDKEFADGTIPLFQMLKTRRVYPSLFFRLESMAVANIDRLLLELKH